MAIDLNRIENLQIDEGTLDSPFILKDNEVTTLYRLALSNNRKIDIRGVVNTTTGTILKYESYQIKKAWPNLTILAREVTTQDWTIQLLSGTITELESTTLLATNISIETLEWQINDISLNVISGSYGEQDVRDHLHFDNTTGRIYYDKPTSNAGWVASVEIAFYPSYIEEPEPEDFRTVILTIRAIAVTSVTITAPSRIDESSTINIALAPYPTTNTKGDGIRYSLQTTYGVLSPSSGTITTRDTFVYYAPPFSAVPYDEDAGGKFYNLSFVAGFYMFGSTTSSGTADATILMKNTEFQVTCDKDSLIEGERAEFTVDGYTWDELQKTMVVDELRLSGITEEELRNRVLFENGPFFSMNAPIDNATYSADVVLYIAPPGADPIGERAKVFGMHLSAIGLTSVTITPQTIGQNIQSIINIEYRPRVHTKGTLSYNFRCDAVNFIRRDDVNGVYTIFSSEISTEGHDATATIYSEYIGTGVPLIQSINKLYVQDIYFNVTFDGEEQRTIAIDEGNTTQCYVDILHISELKKEINVVINNGSEWVDSNWITDRLHFSDDTTTDLIWFDYPQENISWNATITIRFIAKYIPEGVEPPYSQTVVINVDARAVEGIEWQDSNDDNYQIAVTPYRSSKSFKIKTYPYNNTKQVVLESPIYMAENPFSHGALAAGIIMNEILPYGTFSTNATVYGDWLVYGYLDAFSSNPQFGTITTNTFGRTTQNGTPSTQNIVYPKFYTLYDRIANSKVELRRIDETYVDNYTCLLGDEPVTPTLNKNVGKTTLNSETSVTVIENSDTLDSVSFYVQVGGKSNSVDFEKVICSHFAPSDTDISLDGNADTIINYNEDYKFIIRISYDAIGVEDISQETTQTLKEKIEDYITTQYENDTPIVIYYPLETMQSSEYANTLYQDYVFYQTLPYHIYTANNPDNQCSVEFINNDNTAVNRKVFGITYPVDGDNNRAIETMLVNNIRINPSEVSQVPFFSGTPASINQYDSDGNLLLDTNGDPEKGEVNIWENFSGKYEEWTDNEVAKITWDIAGNTTYVQPTYDETTHTLTPGSVRGIDVYSDNTLLNKVSLNGYTWNNVWYGNVYNATTSSLMSTLEKVVLDGTASISRPYENNAYSTSIMFTPPSNVYRVNYQSPFLSTHFTPNGWHIATSASSTDGRNYPLCAAYPNNSNVYAQLPHEVVGTNIDMTAAEVVAAWKAYFQEQYDAGTPVTFYFPKTITTTLTNRTYYTRGNNHYKYTISKLLKEDDSDGTTPNKFNPAFVYNKDGTIPTQFFLSRFTPAWNNDDNETTISMAKGLKAQQRTITKENVLSKGCYYKNNNGELQQISSLYYGPWMAYIWLAYITYGTNNLKNLIGVGASKISADAQIFADDSGTLLTPGQQYGALYIINNPLLNDTTYINYDFNIIGVKDIDDIAKEPISSYKIDSVSVGSVYTIVSLADDEGNPTTYTAVNANDFYSLNACFSKTGYSEENYKDIDGNVVISGYGENSTYYNDSRHPVRCLNVENMWGGGNYIVDGTGFATDVEDTTKVHPLLWNPQDNNQNLNDINTWDKLSDVDVLNQTGTWDIGSVKYYNSKCGWADSPAGANVPYKGFNVYGRLNNLDVDTRYNWSTGNYYDWGENSDLPSICGLGQTSMLVDGTSIPTIKTNTDSYQLVEYLENTSTQYIKTGFSLGKFVHDIQLTSTGARRLMGHSGSNPYWGQKDTNRYELSGATSQVVIGNRDIVTYKVLGSNATLSINGVQVLSSGIGYAASNEYQIFALGGNHNVPGKLYGLKVYNESNALVGNMLPCYRISDNKPGLYDMVRQQFLTNAGSGEFTLGPLLQSAKDLDEDRYFKLDCLNIESSSTNLKYYNANTRLTQNSKIVVEFVSNHSATINSYFGGTKTLDNKTSLNLYVSTDNRLCCENGTSTIYLSDIDTIMPGTKHTIEVECNATTLTAKLDGVQTYSGSSYELDTTLKYYLFTINNQESPTTSKFFNGSIYSFKIYKNNTLAREFLGVYNKKEETFGLYETISMKYHYYDNTIISRIPEAYQEVEYLESDGSQYINTNIYYNENLEFDITFSDFVSANPSQLFGTNKSLFDLERRQTNQLTWFSAVNKMHCYNEFNTTDKYHIICNKDGMTVNDSFVSGQTDSGNIAGSTEFTIFKGRNGNSSYKLYSLIIKNSGAVILDYVPCYRKSDNKSGFYDIVNNVFITSSSSTDFIYGPIIQRELNMALRPVDSIVFKSGQYIDTKWKYKPNSTIQVIAQKSTDSAKSLVFGNEVSNNALSMAISDASKHPYAMIGSTTQALTQNSATNKPYALTLTANASSFNYLVKGNGIASIVKSSDSVGVTAHSTSCFLGGSRGSDGTIVSNSTQNSIYECTIWEGNNIVKHFVPVFNLVSNEAGMYETVNKEFYDNAGTDTLVAGNGNCVESEFIQNTDSANFTTWNFDTNVKFKDTGKIVVDLDVMQSSADGNNKCINGSLSTTTAGSTFLSYSTEIVGGITLVSRVKEGSKVSWVYTYDNDDNTTIHISGAGTTDTGKYNYKRVTIYATDGVTKLRDYVPVKVGVGGFYDTITGATIINQFTTTSTFGPEIDNTVPGDPGMYFEKLKLIVKVFGTL